MHVFYLLSNWEHNISIQISKNLQFWKLHKNGDNSFTFVMCYFDYPDSKIGELHLKYPLNSWKVVVRVLGVSSLINPKIYVLAKPHANLNFV
jgi:hypothetical protein